MERKIGEIFEYNGEWCQCVEGNGCENCAFKGRKCYLKGGTDDPIGECCYDRRRDDKDVVFKKLEKVGESFYSKYLGKSYQRYKTYIPAVGSNFKIRVTPMEYVGRNEIFIEIKQNKEDIEGKKKQTSLDLTKGIYEKFKGKTVQCLVNNKDGDLVNGYGIVCGYTNKYLIIGFTNGYEGCIKSFTDNVFLENRDFLSYRFWNISHVDDKPFIKPFNLESARSGKPVCTRDGRKARIICFDAEGNKPLIVLSKIDGKEVILRYTEKGQSDNFHSPTPREDDLMMLSEKKEGWIFLRKDGYMFDNEEVAKKNCTDEQFVAKVEWEE